MKALVLIYRPDFYWSFESLAKKLTERGHEVKVICAAPTPGGKEFAIPNMSYCDWVNLDFSAIDNFNPDVIFSWNDCTPYHLPAIPMLRGSYPVFVMENGWLPQRGNVYMLESNAFTSRQLEEGFKKYMVTHRPIHHIDLGYNVQRKIDKDYIFVPLQLEGDTSFLYSQFFKNQHQFLRFVEATCGNVPVIVKKHPLSVEAVYSTKPNVEIYEGELTTPELIAGAVATVGVNSTCLIESLVFGTPAYAFGRSPGHGGFLYADIGDKDFVANAFYSRRSLHTTQTTKMVRYLLCNQFNVYDVPEWVIKKVERLDFRPNFIS